MANHNCYQNELSHPWLRLLIYSFSGKRHPQACDITPYYQLYILQSMLGFECNLYQQRLFQVTHWIEY